MTRRRLVALCVAGAIAATAAAVWHSQSEVIGLGMRWYLARIAAREEAAGGMAKRREIVGRMNRLLFMAPPPDAQVPELFDLITAVSSRVATGEINLNWAAYIYSDYQRDLVRDRPAGVPRRAMSDVMAAVDEYVRFFTLQRRPDVPGVRLGDLKAALEGSHTLEDSEAAARHSRDLSRGQTPQH